MRIPFEVTVSNNQSDQSSTASCTCKLLTIGVSVNTNSVLGVCFQVRYTKSIQHNLGR